MGIIRSAKRPREAQSFEIAEGITITSTGAVNIYIPFVVNHIDFFPSSFKLFVHEIVIYIDPVIVDEPEPADYILITHSHSDHFSISDIKRLLKKETVVICPKCPYKKLANLLAGFTVMKIEPEKKIRVGDIIIEVIGAYNIKSGPIVPHSRSAQNVGYIISSGDVSIYHAGDTDYTTEMRALKNITAALIPIAGGNLTLSTEKAAEFVNHLKPIFATPMHYDIGTDEVDEFKRLIQNNIQVIVLDGQKSG